MIEIEHGTSLTISDASEYFDVNEETVRHWIRGNEFPNATIKAKKTGYSIPIDDIMSFVNRHPKYRGGVAIVFRDPNGDESVEQKMTKTEIVSEILEKQKEIEELLQRLIEA